MLAVGVQGPAGVLALIGRLHRGEGEHAPPDHRPGTHPVGRPAWNKHQVESQQRLRWDQDQDVLPVHSMAGVGLPVAEQRNSTRWPCWTFSTDGVTTATGWAPSPAAERNTPVKHPGLTSDLWAQKGGLAMKEWGCETGPARLVESPSDDNMCVCVCLEGGGCQAVPGKGRAWTVLV